AGCADTTTGLAEERRSFQAVALACGSRSMMTAVRFWRSAATARWTASVVFPAPPFCEMMAIVFTTGTIAAKNVNVYSQVCLRVYMCGNVRGLSFAKKRRRRDIRTL